MIAPVVGNVSHGPPMLLGGGTMTSSNLHKICAHPKFEPSNLDKWKREMHFWRIMYQVIPGDQIVEAVCLQRYSELGEIVMGFADGERDSSVLPTFANLLRRIDREYGALAEVQRVDRLQSLMQFKRESSWGIRKFRRNFRRIENHAGEAGVIIPEDILFSQLIVALSLTQSRRHVVLAHFESTSHPKTVGRLQNITIRLFAAYGVVRNGTSALVDDKEGNGIRDGSDEETWIIQGQKGKKGTDRI